MALISERNSSKMRRPLRIASLSLGSAGVVYGDIGTSPIYALREALHFLHETNVGMRQSVIGIVSLLVWALFLVVTIKYVIFIMSADNKGEGGTLSLMALIRGVTIKKNRGASFILGIVGASLFYGDSILTPAVSVLSAVEGIKYVTPISDSMTMSIAIAIIVLLFSLQSRGTEKVATYFSPIMLVWFLTLGLFGATHIADDLDILRAFNPYNGLVFLFSHGKTSMFVIGSVFLAVTGAEALYADMGHFGKLPIRLAWLALIFPMLILTYLGQGALVLHNPLTYRDPFYLMFPQVAIAPIVLLTTLATIIASQAVITGAFSLTRQAVQLGLLPRFEIRHTSEVQAGQIYLPQVNKLLFFGVLILVLFFQTSSQIANAYGIAVAGTMIVDTSLFFLVADRVWKWKRTTTFTLIAAFLAVDLTFFGANLLKIPQGAYMSVIFAIVMTLAMLAWVKGSEAIKEKQKKSSLPLVDLLWMLERSRPVRVSGTAVFLTGDSEAAPSALLHNIKHNKVLHKHNIILTVRTSNTPRVPEAEQIHIEILGEDFKRVIVTVGYMQTPNIPHIMALARRRGTDFDIMQTSFFLRSLSLKLSSKSTLSYSERSFFMFLSRAAQPATDFFSIPSGRVVELGSQLAI